jgi:hypothetical protein
MLLTSSYIDRIFGKLDSNVCGLRLMTEGNTNEKDS